MSSLVPSPPGLHDNPWVCDCRLYDLVQFQKFPTLSVAFIDTRLRCSAPESVSGVLFSDAELRRCQLPRIHTAVARVRSAVGNNVLLRCGTIGVPIPDLTWRKADGRALNGTGESVRLSGSFSVLCLRQDSFVCTVVLLLIKQKATSGDSAVVSLTDSCGINSELCNTDDDQCNIV